MHRPLPLLLLLPLTACAALPEGSFPGECFDGVDNDADGATDCDDAACADACAGSGCREAREVCVNEFMADNGHTIADEYGEYTDWIELHNPSTEGRSLDGFTITDDFDAADPHPLDGHSIPSGGYLLLWASGDASLGEHHLPFKLSVDADSLGLYCPLGGAAQEIEWTESQGADVSTGRIPDCTGGMTPGLAPTPRGSNEQ